MRLPYKFFDTSMFVYTFQIAILIFYPFIIGEIEMFKILFV